MGLQSPMLRQALSREAVAARSRPQVGEFQASEGLGGSRGHGWQGGLANWRALERAEADEN